jgi:glutaredoxin
MGARCEAHDLAVGADGGCVICRREGFQSVGAASVRAPPGANGAVLLAGVLLTIAVGATALGVAWPARGVVRAVPTDVASASSSPNAVDTAAVPVPTEEKQPARKFVPASAPASEAPGAVLGNGKRLDQERKARAEQAHLEAWAHREAQASLVEDEARARRGRANLQAGRQVSVTMYSASWCHVCDAARSYMQEAGIPFTERDVDTDPGARAILHRLNPRGSVPTFDIGGTPLVGFLPESLARAISAAARRE